MLLDLPARLFLLRMIDARMSIAFERPIAAGGVRREPTPHCDGEVSGLLPRADGTSLHGLDHDRPLAADPRDDGRPVFLIMATARLARLAATTRPAPP